MSITKFAAAADSMRRTPDRAQTSDMIAAAFGVNESTARRWVRIMHGHQWIEPHGVRQGLHGIKPILWRWRL